MSLKERKLQDITFYSTIKSIALISGITRNQKTFNCFLPEHAKNNLVRKLRPPPGRTDHKYLAECIKVHLSNKSKLRFVVVKWKQSKSKVSQPVPCSVTFAYQSINDKHFKWEFVLNFYWTLLLRFLFKIRFWMVEMCLCARGVTNSHLFLKFWDDCLVKFVYRYWWTAGVGCIQASILRL